MNKVMTRAHRPTAHPPSRRDARRPGATAPPRTPAGITPSRASDATAHHTPGTTAHRAPGGAAPPRTPDGGSARPPAAGGRPPASARTTTPRTRPTDNRPPILSGTSTAPARARTTAAPAPTRTPTESAPRVPSQSPRRPVAPHPLPTDLFADLLLAVLSGHRPVHSMLRHTRGRAYDELAWLAERGPLRTRGPRPVVRDIGWCEPRPGAIEAFARIGAGDRLRAMAFRLELGQDLRWRCTAVELGGPRPPRAEAD
ncbi:Rv3235 family protein [Streptomyces sp. NPDC006372]|uniref:Rv3235 family protein n=1 Tax=Streptomyces sp. NPDC006372 TaxID=3155599 RepID=UPI0033B8BC63